MQKCIAQAAVAVSDWHACPNVQQRWCDEASLKHSLLAQLCMLGKACGALLRHKRMTYVGLRTRPLGVVETNPRRDNLSAMIYHAQNGRRHLGLLQGQQDRLSIEFTDTSWLFHDIPNPKRKSQAPSGSTPTLSSLSCEQPFDFFDGMWMASRQNSSRIWHQVRTHPNASVQLCCSTHL